MPFPRPLGMSPKKDAPAGAPFQPTPVRASNPNNNDQRQGIIMAMVSCLLLFLTAYDILGLVQQIGTCRGEAPPSCCARPFCRLKAPLGLSLLRSAPQTRTCRGEAPPSCCRKTVLSLKSPTGAFIVLLRSTNANLVTQKEVYDIHPTK